MARSIVARPPGRRGLGLDCEALLAQHREHLLRLVDDLGPDAVTGEDRDFHGLTARRARDLRRAHHAPWSGKPGLIVEPPRLEFANLVGVLQREPDVVPSVQQAALAERIGLETEDEAA